MFVLLVSTRTNTHKTFQVLGYIIFFCRGTIRSVSPSAVRNNNCNSKLCIELKKEEMATVHRCIYVDRYLRLIYIMYTVLFAVCCLVCR